MSERACRTCKLVTTENRCPRCGGTDLSDSFSGLLIVFDPKGSELAKIAGIKEPGVYALRVR
ncbi:MAG TPA: hypothetical protein ENF98_01030 [Candidatus Bathyarchaeota archaeon]|nr:hypothetical protein [Candidatus Bathyarchaeota archaeon]